MWVARLVPPSTVTYAPIFADGAIHGNTHGPLWSRASGASPISAVLCRNPGLVAAPEPVDPAGVLDPDKRCLPLERPLVEVHVFGALPSFVVSTQCPPCGCLDEAR